MPRDFTGTGKLRRYILIILLLSGLTTPSAALTYSSYKHDLERINSIAPLADGSVLVFGSEDEEAGGGSVYRFIPHGSRIIERRALSGGSGMLFDSKKRFWISSAEESGIRYHRDGRSYRVRPSAGAEAPFILSAVEDWRGAIYFECFREVFGGHIGFAIRTDSLAEVITGIYNGVSHLREYTGLAPLSHIIGRSFDDGTDESGNYYLVGNGTDSAYQFHDIYVWNGRSIIKVGRLVTDSTVEYPYVRYRLSLAPPAGALSGKPVVGRTFKFLAHPQVSERCLPWIGTFCRLANGTLLALDDTDDTVPTSVPTGWWDRIRVSIGKEKISGMAQTNDGAVWIVSSKRIYRFQDRRFGRPRRRLVPEIADADLIPSVEPDQIDERDQADMNERIESHLHSGRRFERLGSVFSAATEYEDALIFSLRAYGWNPSLSDVIMGEVGRIYYLMKLDYDSAVLPEMLNENSALELLKSRNHRLASLGARALGATRSRNAAKPLIARLAAESKSLDTGDNLRSHLAWAIGRIGGRRALLPLRKASSSNDLGLAVTAAVALANMSDFDAIIIVARRLDTLPAWAVDSDYGYGESLYAAIKRLIDRAPESRLRRLINERSETVRELARQVLAKRRQS